MTVINLTRIFRVILVAASVNHPSICSPIIAKYSDCRATGNNPDSLLYSLAFSDQDKLVTVYHQYCSNLSTIGPSWYRLEVTNLEETFLAPKNRSGAVLKENGIEFSASDDQPLVLLDLPRTFRYITNTPLENICFRLTIKQGDDCEQVVSNCTDDGDRIVEKRNVAAKSSTIPNEIVNHLSQDNDCYRRHNCTGKIKKVCGTDGNIYNHICELRLHRCTHNLIVQRDNTGISCTRNTSAPNKSTPPTPKSPCTEYVESVIAIGYYYIPKCDQHGFFKPVQCQENNGIIQCYCYGPITGSAYGPGWEVDCNNTSLPQSHCGI